MPESDMEDVIRQFTDPRTSHQINAFIRRVLAEEGLRARFMEDPAAVLREGGIDMGRDVRLGDKDRALLTLLGDTTIADMYRTGRISELQGHVRDNYSALVNPGHQPQEVGAVEMDFDVFIEVEAIAVAIVVAAAIVPVLVEQPGEVMLQRMSDMEATLAARLANVEQRLIDLEGR